MSAPPTFPDAALPQPTPLPALSPTVNRIVFVLSLLGFLVSGYLWFAHARHIDVPCVGGAAASSDCARLDNSPYAQFPVGSGVPVALYGTLGYLLLAGLAFARTLGAGPDAPRRDRRLLTLIVLAAGAGVLFSLRLTYFALFVVQPRATCPWCLTSLALISGTFAASAWELLRRRKQAAAANTAATAFHPFRAS